MDLTTILIWDVAPLLVAGDGTKVVDGDGYGLLRDWSLVFGLGDGELIAGTTGRTGTSTRSDTKLFLANGGSEAGFCDGT